MAQNAGEAPQDKLYTALTKHCPEESVDGHYRMVSPVVNRMAQDENLDKALEAVVPTACFLEFQPWRMKLGMQLGHYGISNSLKVETVSHMTQLLQNRSMGKDAYLATGRNYEYLASSGLNEDEVNSVFNMGINGGFRSEQMKLLFRLYVNWRGQGENKKEALSALKEKSAEIRKLYSEDQIEKYYQEESAAGKKKSSLEKSGSSDRQMAGTSGDNWDQQRLKLFVDDWTGTPYYYGGMTKKGVDCSGFVVLAAQDQFPQNNLPHSANMLSKMGEDINHRTDLLPGDFIFFSANKKSKKITHVGIYLGDQQFAHASTKRGVTVSSLKSQYYLDRYVSASRVLPLH